VIRRRKRSSPAPADLHVHQPPMAEPAVAAALAALPPNHRAVVVCRLMLGWSELQTAEALRIRPGTVKSRLHRANTRLQSELHHLRPEDPL
jgi:DNA-directed RNA polymerase specialized sigma24 family protein